MSIDKANLKTLVYQDVGVKLDDLLEGAEKLQLQFAGGKAALLIAKRNILNLVSLVDTELDEQKIPDIETAEHVKRFLTRAVASLESAARNCENQEISAGGGAAFGSKAVKLIKQLQEQEQAKAKAAKEALSQADIPSGSDDRRAVGTRPALSIAAQRRKEAQKENVQTTKKTTKKKTKKKVVKKRA